MRFANEEERRSWYHQKYGDLDGEKRYRKAAGIPLPKSALPDPSVGGGSILDKIQEKAPKRRVPKPSKTEVVQAVGTAVAATDQIGQWFYPPWREDHLSFEEIGRLADALADEILSSEKLTKWLVKAQSSSVHVKLAMVCASIALPRMQKHGMVPSMAGAAPPGPNGSAPPEGVPIGSHPGDPFPEELAQMDYMPVGPQ